MFRGSSGKQNRNSDVAGPWGSISPCDTVEVADGADRTFSILPANNFKTLYVLVDGGSVGPVSTYTFSNVSANHSIHTDFTVAFDIEGGAVVPKKNFSGEEKPDPGLKTNYYLKREYRRGYLSECHI